MAFLDELAANATEHGIKFVFYSGNDDSFITHFGTEGTPHTVCHLDFADPPLLVVVVIQVYFACDNA